MREESSAPDDLLALHEAGVDAMENLTRETHYVEASRNSPLILQVKIPTSAGDRHRSNFNRGRTASYPTAPSRIPACGILAPGSSVLLAAARAEVITRGEAELGRAAG